MKKYSKLAFICTATVTTVTALLLVASCSSPSIRKDSRVIAEETAADNYISDWQEEKKDMFFDWPVDRARMTRGFLPEKSRPHLGIDLAAPKGTPILASHDGVVVYAGKDFSGFGKMVLVEGRKGWASLYAHLNKISVKIGDQVSQGDPLGEMGRTGRASGVHLHFEIRRAKGPVDPLLYLPAATKLTQK